MELLIPDWEDLPANVGAFTTLRRGGVSPAPYGDGCGSGGLNLGDHVGDAREHVAHNRSLLNRLLPSAPVWLAQVHGTRVVEASAMTGVPEADAAISAERGAVCAIMTADCLPVLLCDTAGTVVGAVHAGWRGLAEGVIENTVDAMRQAGASEITAWLGPAIGPQAFEVGSEVREAFISRQPEAASAFLSTAAQGKYLADIYALARLRLQAVNIDKVYGGGFCTFTDSSRFYSYRRDKATGRMATLIWLK
jgi:YfiH family protein